MPVQYTVDPTRRLVVSSVAPPLSSFELMRLCSDLSTDKRFKPNFKQLHEVHAGALASIHYRDLAHLKEEDPFATSSIRAIVVHTDDDYGMARLYELLRGGNLHVFRSMREAERFLRL
jgi:hypothetical protein